MQDYCVVLCTCPNEEVARKIANNLVASKYVACINIVENLNSIYFWKGKVEEGQEVLLVMKTRQSRLPALESALLAQHPYEFPEFIALPIIYGNAHYLKWLDEVVTPGTVCV